jgi:hypothetical protein
MVQRLWINDPVVGFSLVEGKWKRVTQVKRWSLAMLLMSSVLVATAAPAFAHLGHSLIQISAGCLAWESSR